MMLDLNRYMNQLFMDAQLIPEVLRFGSFRDRKREDAGEFPLPHAPDMEVGNIRLNRARLDQFTSFLSSRLGTQ